MAYGPNPAQSSTAAGSALATFLLGVATGQVNPAPALAQQTTYYALFLQDDFKVTPKLTLNLGLRYDYEWPRTDRFNQLTNFDYALKPPLDAPGLDLHGALTFVGVRGAPRFNAEPDRNNFAPRAGLAYKLTGKTVVRASVGIFFTATTGMGTGSSTFGVSGFSNPTTIVTSLDGLTPITFLRNPYPDGILKPAGSSLGAATMLGQSVNYFDPGNRVPYSEQWSFNIQRELPWRVLFDIGYAGTRGLKMPDTRQFNRLPDEALKLGNSLRDLVPNPFYGQILTGTFAAKTVARAQLLRPHPQFDNVSSQSANWTSSNYHALQVKIERRYSRGLSILGSYTWSKLMDYGAGLWSGESLGGASFQNNNYLRGEWAVSGLDQTHRLSINSIYTIPLFRQQKGVLGNMRGGWEVGAIYSGFSGSPLGVSCATNTTYAQGGGQRPNWTGISPKLKNPTPDRWFDTSPFTPPAAYSFGNAGRVFNGYRADGTTMLDASIHKYFKLTERAKLQFRAELFNATNTVRFAPPNTSFGGASFGVVSSQGNQPRIVQFALKVLY